MFGELLDNVRREKPMVHCISNIVSANDCANILLACGAAPIMAQDEAEVEEITSLCQALVINIGTINRQFIPSMFAAGKMASLMGHPVILDPVGVGASTLRGQTVKKLIHELDISVIRGNFSEIKAIALGTGDKRGVDADLADKIDEENLEKNVDFIKALAANLGCVIAVTGKIDIVADGKMAYCIYNGDEMMRYVTGSGCQLSALTGAFAGANSANILDAAAAAAATMGVCGQIARERLTPLDGSGTYRGYIIDAVYNITRDALDSRAKYKVI